MSAIETLRQLLAPRPTQDADVNVVRLVAILDLSNRAEAESDPFQRRLRLNEMQEAIQGARDDLEALAEGLIFLPD